ncbi:34624_t:CDS:2, partial [Gigaspora margarita]
PKIVSNLAQLGFFDLTFGSKITRFRILEPTYGSKIAQFGFFKPTFGSKVTSHVEAAHAALKRCLQSSVCDLESVHRKTVLQIESQARKTRALISSEHMKVHYAHRTSLLEPLLHHVSTFALNKIRTEWIKVLSATPDSPLNPCTRTFKSTMRLPCSHTISELLVSGQVLQQTDIHEHWWIQGCHIEFLEPTYLANNDHNDLQPLVQSLKQMYQFWPPHQQATIYA